MNNQIKRVILVSLAADFIASLLYIFALQLKNQMILLCFYVIAILLVVSSILACFNNFRKHRYYILLFMFIFNVILIALYTLVLFYH